MQVAAVQTSSWVKALKDATILLNVRELNSYPTILAPALRAGAAVIEVGVSE